MAMKKNKILLETKFWASYEITDPFELITAFYDYWNIEYYKNTLSEIMLHVCKAEVYRKDRPCDVFDFYKAVRSFLRAAYQLTSKAGKWKVTEPPEEWQIMAQASLTSDEYQNPFSVFKKAFEVCTLEEYDFFLSEIVHVALSPYTEESDYDLITPYIHLVKMFDAAQVLSERGVARIRK